MEENTQVTVAKEMTLFDVFAALRKKIKLIVRVTLVVAIIGGVLGGLMSMLWSSYGAVISFHVSPYDGSDSLLYKLQSESFAERLLLDENGLPPKDECDPEDYENAVKAIEALNVARAKKLELSREIGMLPYSLAIIEEEYERLTQAYNNAYNVLSIYTSSPSDKVAEDEAHKAMISLYEQKLKEAEQEREAYAESTYNPAIANKLKLDAEYAQIARDVTDLRDEVKELTEAVLAPWRENEDVKEDISVIMKSVTYEYEKLEASQKDNTSTSKDEEPHKGYVKVTVNVERDEEFAQFIVDQIKSNMGFYVIDHIESSGGYTKVRCELISTVGAIEETGDGTIISAVKFAAIAAIVAMVVVCCVVIAKVAYEKLVPAEYKSNKKKENVKNKKAE